jgi:1-acyl-sn-glycerol-3-phosphate acyltransferase
MLEQIIYRTVRIYVRIVLRFFYRTWQIEGVENIPKNAAVIYVVNHQNAFLDAILVACATRDEPWFLTRAGVFANVVARKVLSIFHMMPVYRFRDGMKSLRNNDAIIRQCIDILKAKKSILLFVEGDQGMRWQLRPLQKGFARIAWAAQQENNWKLPLYMVPVGIQYDHHYSFRSRVLLNYGRAIPLDSSYQQMSERECMDAWVNLVKDNLKPLMLHIEDDKYEAVQAYVIANRKQKDLLLQLKHNQEVAAGDIKQLKSDPPKAINYVLLLVAMPLHIYILINNFLVYILTSWFLKKYVTIEFKASLKLAFGMVVVPLFYLIQSAIIQRIFHDWRITLTYLITLPFITVWSVDLFKMAIRKNQ